MCRYVAPEVARAHLAPAGDMQPVFADCPAYGDGLDRELFESGLCLPSGSSLTDSEVARVIEALKEALR